MSNSFIEQADRKVLSFIVISLIIYLYEILFSNILIHKASYISWKRKLTMNKKIKQKKNKDRKIVSKN